MNAARQAAVMIVLLAASSLALPAAAQSSSAMRDCAHLLETPTKDSVTLHARFQVQAATRAHDMPDWFQEDIASAIRTRLRIPQPLGIAVYETDWEQPAQTAHPVLRSLIRAATALRLE